MCYIRLSHLFLTRSRSGSRAQLTHLHAHIRYLLLCCTGVKFLALSHPLYAGKTFHIRLYVCRLALVLVFCMLLGCYSLLFLASFCFSLVSCSDSHLGNSLPHFLNGTSLLLRSLKFGFGFLLPFITLLGIDVLPYSFNSFFLIFSLKFFIHQ